MVAIVERVRARRLIYGDRPVAEPRCARGDKKLRVDGAVAGIDLDVKEANS